MEETKRTCLLKRFFTKHKALAVTLTAIISVILVFVLLCLSTYIPRSGDTDYDSEACQNNRFIVSSPLISAHRAGRTLAPENTMAAFKKCFDKSNDYAVDILEFDLHITKDKHLVLMHDDTFDRTSDCTTEKFGEKDVKAEDKTLAQLLQYNLGYNFEDEDGEYPYRAEGADLSDCRVITVEQTLEYMRSQEREFGRKFSYVIEIKNKGDLGKEAADILCGVLKKMDMTDRTIVGTFHGEISKYLDGNYPDVIRSASPAEVLDFYFSCMFGVNLDKKETNYKVLQIPYNDYVINLGKKSIIDYAHKYGIAVQYWTINKAKEIEHLYEIGADAVITDNPRLAYQIIKEK